MPQYPRYPNPLDALKRARSVGPPRKTPDASLEAGYPSIPPRPSLVGAFGSREDEGLNIPDPPVYNPTGPALQGLQMGPVVRPGALTPTKAASTFQSSQPERKPEFSPGIQELFQLAGRRDWDNINPEARTGYGYGVAPGSSELWGQKLQERLAEEEFNLPEAEAARQMKMYELGGPERVAAITERGGLEKARMTGEFGLKGIESKGGQALNFLDMMNQARAGGANVSRFSVPGGPSVSFSRESELPTQLLQEVRGAKAALEASKDWKGSYAPEAQVSFDQTVQNALLRYPAEDSVKLFLSGVLRDPDYKNMNLDDIMQAEGYQEGEISPEDYQAASLFLSAIRGQ